MSPSIPDADKHVLSDHDISTEVDGGLEDWRPLFGQLAARFATGDFATGARLVAKVAEVADGQDHHPDVDLRYGFVEVRTWSHDVGGVTRRDLRLARAVSEAAHALGVSAVPGQLQAVEWALDTWDAGEVKPFWAAVLGLEEAEQDVVDPAGRWPSVWFQPTEQRPGHLGEHRQRWHADVRVPPEVVQERITAVLQAGGRLVSDDQAPAFWVLEDPQGNRACLTTWLGRGPGPAA